MALICAGRTRSREYLLLAMKNDCEVFVDRGARDVLVQTMEAIHKQLKCTTANGEEFRLCERTLSSGSVGVKILTSFDKLQIGDLVDLTVNGVVHENAIIYKIDQGERAYFWADNKGLSFSRSRLDKQDIEICIKKKKLHEQAAKEWAKLETGVVITIQGKQPLWVDCILGAKLCCQNSKGEFDFTSIGDLIGGKVAWKCATSKECQTIEWNITEYTPHTWDHDGNLPVVRFKA